jgi:hypothetical protein
VCISCNQLKTLCATWIDVVSIFLWLICLYITMSASCQSRLIDHQQNRSSVSSADQSTCIRRASGITRRPEQHAHVVVLTRLWHDPRPNLVLESWTTVLFIMPMNFGRLIGLLLAWGALCKVGTHHKVWFAFFWHRSGCGCVERCPRKSPPSPPSGPRIPQPRISPCGKVFFQSVNAPTCFNASVAACVRDSPAHDTGHALHNENVDRRT